MVWARVPQDGQRTAAMVDEEDRKPPCHTVCGPNHEKNAQGEGIQQSNWNSCSPAQPPWGMTGFSEKHDWDSLEGREAQLLGILHISNRRLIIFNLQPFEDIDVWGGVSVPHL